MRVLVIGAGIIGLSVADALVRRGAEVTVLDMRAPGRGASWASAGLLAPYTEAHGQSPLLKMGLRSLSMFDEFVRGAEERSGRRVEYSRAGTLEVAMSAADVDRFRGTSVWLRSIDVAFEWLDETEVRKFEPSLSPKVVGGLFIGTHGFVGVGSLVSALLNSARFGGATVETSIEVVEVTSDKNGAIVRAGDRTWTADHIVVAAGAWSKRVRVAGAPPMPVRPVKGQLLYLKWTANERPARPVWSAGCYTVPWSDGTLLAGATVEEAGFDESTTVAAVQSLSNAVIDVLPGASAAGLIEARSGLRPAASDGLPIVGAIAGLPRVSFATAHYRNGILLAPLTAAVIEAAVLDGRPDAMMEEASPNRFMISGGR